MLTPRKCIPLSTNIRRHRPRHGQPVFTDGNEERSFSYIAWRTASMNEANEGTSQPIPIPRTMPVRRQRIVMTSGRPKTMSDWSSINWTKQGRSCLDRSPISRRHGHAGCRSPWCVRPSSPRPGARAHGSKGPARAPRSDPSGPRRSTRQVGVRVRHAGRVRGVMGHDHGRAIMGPGQLRLDEGPRRPVNGQHLAGFDPVP